MDKEKVIGLVKEIGYIVSFDNDIENMTYLDSINLEDSDGYKYQISWASISRKRKNFKRFIDKNPHSLYNAKKYIKENNIEVEILSEEFKAVTEKLKFKCKCGEEFYNTWSRFLSRTHKTCDKCTLEDRISRKLEEEKVFESIKEYGYFPLDGECYNGNMSHIKCKDSEGYKYLIKYGNLTSGRTPYKFNPYNPYTIHNINNMIKLSGFDTKCTDKVYTSEDTLLNFKCGDCGDIYQSSSANMISAINKVCPKCTRNISSYARKVCLWLEEKGIEFEQEKRFEDCKNERPLPFDFYVKDLNMAIEVDGEGHYNPINFNGCTDDLAMRSYQIITKNDKIKNVFCNANRIKIVRIPYWVFKDDTYKEILNNSVFGVAN